MNNYRIVYFSGTGCTALAADALAKALRSRGREAAVERITAGPDPGVTGTFDATLVEPGLSRITAGPDRAWAGTFDALILLFPVYGFTAPGPVIEWIEGIGCADGTPAAVISVSGGGEICPNRAGRVSAVKALKRKGYGVFFEETIVMPSNLVVATPEPLAIMLLKVLPEKAGAIADDILAGDVKRTPAFFVDRFFAWIGRSLGRYSKSWGRKIVVSDECDGCGLCAEQCPSTNIAMAGSRPALSNSKSALSNSKSALSNSESALSNSESALSNSESALSNSSPVFSDKCCMCLGCFYACPKGALTPKTGKAIILKDFDLKSWEEKAPACERADAANVRAGFIWNGVKKYLE